jgi:tetratricopeptide (TPR) repeat protein
MYQRLTKFEWQHLELGFALRLHRRAAVAAGAFVVTLAAALLLTGPVAQASPQPCTPEQGQAFIDTGRFKDAIREFTCVIAAQPTEAEGYRGRIEAELLLNRFSDAAADHARITALVLPVHPDAHNTILAGYAARLADDPESIPALTGASFARWWFFDYANAIHLLNRLLDLRPDDLYGTLLRGSNRMLLGANKAAGAADLERAIALSPQSPDVRFIVADAYTYGQPDPQRAFAEATLALNWGLDTPRVHAILASSYLAFGDMPAAASEFKTHIDLVTNELVSTSPLAAGASLSVDLAAYRTYEIPVPATAGQTISIATSSRDFYDSICVLIAPDGTPVVGSDDYIKWFAGFQWQAQVTGTYTLLVTSFEGVWSGELTVTRD